MWELDYKEGWAPKNSCFWTVELEKSLESPLDCKEIRPVNLKEISSEYSLEALMLKMKLQYFDHITWITDSLENTLTGKDWRQEKWTAEDEMVGWHHWLDGDEFEQAAGFGDGQGSRVCFSSHGWKLSDMTEQLNWTAIWFYIKDQ